MRLSHRGKDGRTACYPPPRFELAETPSLTGYIPVVIFLALILAFAVASLIGAWIIRPSRKNAANVAKAENYECGAEPIGEAWVQFPVGFYLVALLFLVFDTLAVFLFPWVVVYREFKMVAFVEMLIFIGLVLAGFFYIWKKGALDWSGEDLPGIAKRANRSSR